MIPYHAPHNSRYVSKDIRSGFLFNKVPNQGNSKKWLYNTNLTEPFDVAEVEGTNSSDALVELNAEAVDVGWFKNTVKPVLYSDTPAPDDAIDILQLVKDPVLKVQASQNGQTLTWNPAQQLKFDLLDVIEKDYQNIKNSIYYKAKYNYDQCINKSYCGGQPFYNQGGNTNCVDKSTKTFYDKDSDPFCLSTANSSIPAALQPVLNNTFSPNPPAGMAS